MLLMYFKLAFRNIKRSMKDYFVYFITLVFAVCIFYAFNLVNAQSVLLDLSKEQKSIFEAVDKVLGVFSIFISCVLGFLIVYANNYLIKRRKKELGTYLILGMDKHKVSKILFIETFFIGIISLLIGTVLGIITSEGMSIITAKLFKADMSNFKFVFSYKAFIITLFAFSLIYIIVFMFNFKTLRKVKVINLLNASKKNESIKVKNLTLSVILFIISVCFIGIGYYLILSKSINSITSTMPIAIGFGAVGTFLLFMSLSGFLLKVLKSCKGVYFKELNMFLLRQINSKINTTFVSMTFICLMIFVSICTLSGGISIANGMNKNLKDLSPQNVTLFSYTDVDINGTLKNGNFDYNKYFKDYHDYKEYNTDDFRYSTFLSSEDMKKLNDFFMVADDEPITIIKLSDYNKELELMNQEKIELSSDEYACFSDIVDIKDILNNMIDSNKEISIDSHKLKPKKIKAKEITFQNATMKNNMVTVVVDDSIINSFKVRNCYLNAKTVNTDDYDELNSALEKALNGSNINSVTDKQVIASSQGIGAMIAYIGIYLGVIFVISSAAVLAIQQLSETSDNYYRYNLLRKIGADESIINKSLFRQIGIYFFMPLIVALIHSIAGLKMSQKIVSTFTQSVKITDLILISGVFIVVIYGGYFIVTYLSAKKSINN